MLALAGLEGAAERSPQELSLGQRKLAGVARALATRPRVLLLDEPAAGLDAHESEQLGRRIRALAEQGLTIVLVDHGLAPRIAAEILATLRRLADTTGLAVLLVEQHVRMVLETADRAYVLRRGELALAGAAAEVARRRDVLEESYLGEAGR